MEVWTKGGEEKVGGGAGPVTQLYPQDVARYIFKFFLTKLRPRSLKQKKGLPVNTKSKSP